jgi:DNA-binding transcriptional MocR family regulator
VLLLRLDEKSRTPLHRQILERVKEKLLTGVVRPGERLPSTRALACKLGVHRSTVALAYQQLWALGYVDLRPGARPRARARALLAQPSDRTAPGLIDWRKVATPTANAALDEHRAAPPSSAQRAEPRAISFAPLEVDRRLFPLVRFRSCLSRAFDRYGEALMRYGAPAGFWPLRQTVAARLVAHGIAVTADDVLLTNGSQQAIDLVFRMIAQPGKTVAVESPTYNATIALLRLHGLKPVEIPLSGAGLDLQVLADAMRRNTPALVYTMPSFQNPTGLSTTQAHREGLLSLCEAQRVPILEDGFEEEMQYAGKVVLPLKSMDRRRVVIYAGTFSKVLFPGVRIGWVAADRECIDRLVALRRFSEIAPSMVAQAAIDEFCRDGSYDRHIARMHRVFRKRMRAALDALRTHIRPEWAEWSEPAGGYLIWLRLRPLPSRRSDLARALAEHGVEAGLGHVFFYSRRPPAHLRLSIATLTESEIAKGVLRLAAAFQELYSRRRA